MQLSQQAIEEFKEIYHEECGESLSDGEALELAISFFNLMQAIYRPFPGGTCVDPTCTVHSPSYDAPGEARQGIA